MNRDYNFISFCQPERTISIGGPVTVANDGTPLIFCKRITRAQQTINIYADDDFGGEFKFMEIHISQVNFVMPAVPNKTIIATNYKVGNRIFGRVNENKPVEEWHVKQRDDDGFWMQNVTGDVEHSNEFIFIHIVEKPVEKHDA